MYATHQMILIFMAGLALGTFIGAAIGRQFRSEQEADQLDLCRRLNIEAWKAYVIQRDETRAAQKGLLRLQRRIKLASSPPLGE